MNNRLKHILLACIAAVGLQQATAQDIHFSQFYETSILRNPSLTGLFTGDYKVGVVYRNQWSSISKPFQTALANVEARIPINEVNDYLSIGVLGYYDRAGSINLKTTSVYPAINYNKSLEDGHNSYLSVGFTAGYIQRSFDPTRATFNNQYMNNSFNPSNPSGENMGNPTINYWDMGAGVTFSSSANSEENALNYVIGAGAYHIMKPKTSFYNSSDIRLMTRWNGNFAISKQLNQRFSFQAHINYSKQGAYSEIIGGGLIGWHKYGPNDGLLFVLFGGVFYRYNDAIIPTLKLRFKDLAFTCSYDLNASKLRAASNMQGGYEISVVKTGLINSPDKEKSRTICPEFY